MRALAIPTRAALAFAVTAFAASTLIGAAMAAPVGNGFTYQGQLLKSNPNGTPYTGNADFRFRLFNDLVAGTQVGPDVNRNGLGVTGGAFTTELDFGAVFSGTALWLEVSVQTPGDAGFTTLAPRQSLTATPYALFALNAPGTGPNQWINGALGIHTNGNVGVGIAAGAEAKLHVDTGAGALNPGWFSTQNPSFPALVTANTGPNGWGIFDYQSPRHHFQGSLAVGTTGTTPPTGKVHAYGDPNIPAIYATTLGNAWAVVGYGRSDPLALPAGGVQGVSVDARAVEGRSTNNIGVVGDCVSAGTYGMLGTPNEGVFALSPVAAKPAAHFRNAQGSGLGLWVEGRAKVSVLEITGGADLAEPFAVRDEGGIEPGALVVIDEVRPGGLRLSDQPYDSRVAGVISGANDLQPGMMMHAEGQQHGGGDHPVALTGRVWCKVDASFGAIRPGDLLTTSGTPGHAMKASDVDRRAGAVIGKAMTSLEAGRGLVLALVSLQ